MSLDTSTEDMNLFRLLNPKNAIIAGTRSKELYNVATWILMKSNVLNKNMGYF